MVQQEDDIEMGTQNASQEERTVNIAIILGRINQGGIESMVSNWLKEFSDPHFRFFVFAQCPSLFLNGKNGAALGYEFIVTPSITKPFKYIRFLKCQFQEKRIDIVHAQINSLSFLPLFAAKKARIKTRIAHSHTSGSWKEPVRNLAKVAFRPLTRMLCTHRIACSKKAAIWLFGKTAWRKNKVEIIENGVDVNRFAYNALIRDEARKELGVSTQTVIGHIGRFNKQKNHLFLIEIFHQYKLRNPASVLLLIGDGPLAESVEQSIAKRGLEDSVIRVKKTECPERFYQAMDCFVLTSIYEGLPVVGVEAQAAGLPLLLSKAITDECKVLESTRFLSLKESAAVWAEAIPAPLTEEERKKGSAYFQNSRFNLQTQTKKLEGLYHLWLTK